MECPTSSHRNLRYASKKTTAITADIENPQKRSFTLQSFHNYQPPTSEPAGMDTFPQEIVDMIIDQLANYILSSSGKPANISWYSTVSRQWVARTQKYLFESVHLNGQSGLEKWCRAIEPNPAGVSRHVNELSLRRVHRLEGLDSHIRAFACIEALIFDGCGFLLFPSVVKSFAPLGSTLVRLTIDSA